MYPLVRNYSYQRRLLSLTLILGCLIGSFAIPYRNVNGQTKTNELNQTPPARELLASERVKHLSQRPLSFESNQGQSDARVKFLSRARNYTFFLTPTEAVLSLRQKDDQNPSVLRMRLVGANPSPKVVGQDELPGKVNYFNGRDSAGWRSNVSTFAKVHYTEVYPGVDMVYYGKQQQLEYDFIVAPNRDPRKIRLAFSGARSLAIDKTGALVLETAGGQIRQQPPVAYQEIDGRRQTVTAHYVLKNQQQVSFEVGDYDPARTLVIDPVIDYSTYLGGSSVDEGNDIAVDANGYVYVTGITFSANFPLDHAIKATCANCSNWGSDAFIAKIAPWMGVDSLVSSTFWGHPSGFGYSEGRAIAIDSENNVWVAGITTALNFPTTPGSLQPVFQSFGGNGFLTKFDLITGTLLYSTYLQGNNVDEPSDLAVDNEDNVYVAGRTASTNFPVTPSNAYQAYNFGSFDGFVMKFVPLNGNYDLRYSTYLGGHSSDGASNIAVDVYGNVYLTGSTQSADLPGTPQYDGFPVMNAYQSIKGPGQDAFVTKIDPMQSGSASLLYSTYLGGNGNENATVQVGGIAVDKSGMPQVYVTGTTNSTDFPRRNAWKDTPGGYDVFVTKIDASLAGDVSLIYSTFLGGVGLGVDFGNDIAVDNSGQAYVTGATQSNDFPTRCGFADAPSWDGFITVLDSSGSDLVFSTYLGANGYDQINAIAIDTTGTAYVTGHTDSSNFPVVDGFQSTQAGVRDAFVTKITPSKCS